MSRLLQLCKQAPQEAQNAVSCILGNYQPSDVLRFISKIDDIFVLFYFCSELCFLNESSKECVCDSSLKSETIVTNAMGDFPLAEWNEISGKKLMFFSHTAGT